MPIGDGDYVLWLKFSEVWFNLAGLKVFDVALNDVVVIKELDIFAKVGRGVAHDEVVGFKVRSNKIIIEGKSQPFTNDVRVDFVKTDRDNPKINAIIILKGTPDRELGFFIFMFFRNSLKLFRSTTTSSIRPGKTGFR